MPLPELYFDNCICSGIVLRDLASAEMQAADKIVDAQKAGTVKICTSRQAHVEQERTRSPTARAALGAHRADVERIADDHVVLGFSSMGDQYGGFIASPLVSDVVDAPLLASLKSEGLKEGDARHLMYAVAHGCDWFITTDPDFGIGEPLLRAALEIHCRGLRIRAPSEIVTTLAL